MPKSRRRRPPTLDPTRPNAGIEQAYRRRLDRAVDRLHGSVAYWLTAAYRANEPEIAADESPAMTIRKAMRTLTKRWSREFDRLAQEYATGFVREVRGHSDAAFAASLRKAGFTVRFRLTAPVNDVMQASVGENVSLIKSIAADHLTQVEGIVMRSVQRGRDLGDLAQELEERFGVTRRRAAFIARDQNNKATSAITEARQKEMGVSEAVWLHSGGGKTPRPSHVAASGKIYEVGKGMLIDGEWIRPGEKPNCRCVSRSVIPGFS